MPKLLDVVTLTVDLPEYNLLRGQVGTIVELLVDGTVFEVEFSDSDWQAYEFVALNSEQIMVLHFEPTNSNIGKVILTIEDDGVMWIDEIGNNPATSMEVAEDDVGYFKTDNLFELLERRVNNDLQHDLDNVDMYLGDLASVIKVQQNRVKLTRDKLNQITDDEVTAIKTS